MCGREDVQMRYVNLKKRHTSKLASLTKRLAGVSIICLAITAVIVLPLTAKASDILAKQENQVIEIDNEYLGDDAIEVLNQTTFDK